MKTSKTIGKFLREMSPIYFEDGRGTYVESLIEFLKTKEQELRKKWAEKGHENIEIKFDVDVDYDRTDYFFNVYSDETPQEIDIRLAREEKNLRQKKEQQKKKAEEEKALYLKLKKKYGDINE